MVLSLPSLFVAVSFGSCVWPLAMPTSSSGTKTHECATAGHIVEWRRSAPWHNWPTQMQHGGSRQPRGEPRPPALLVGGAERHKHSSSLGLLTGCLHLLWCQTGRSRQKYRSRQICSNRPGGSGAVCMSEGLRGWTCSRCWTVGEQGEGHTGAQNECLSKRLDMWLVLTCIDRVCRLRNSQPGGNLRSLFPERWSSLRTGRTRRKSFRLLWLRSNTWTQK